MIDVLLVAPVRAYRDAVCSALRTDETLRRVIHAASGSEALSRMAPGTPEVALLDFDMDDVLPILTALRRQVPTMRMVAIAVSTPTHAKNVVRAAQAGVTGFVDADQPIADVIGAIHLAVRGQSSCSPTIAAILLEALQRRPPLTSTTHRSPTSRTVPSSPGATQPTPDLTPRELVVAQLAARGLTNRQIAGELVLGEATVKTHVHAVLHKLGVRRREQIALSGVLDLHMHASR